MEQNPNTTIVPQSTLAAAQARERGAELAIDRAQLPVRLEALALAYRLATDDGERRRLANEYDAVNKELWRMAAPEPQPRPVYTQAPRNAAAVVRDGYEICCYDSGEVWHRVAGDNPWRAGWPPAAMVLEAAA